VKEVLLIMTLLSVLNALRCTAQGNTFPRGIYTSIESLKSRTPDGLDTLDVVNMGYGQPFVLESQSKSLKKRFIKKEVLAYVHDGSVFLNGRRLGLQAGYWLAVTQGQYVAFYYKEPRDNAGVVAASVLFGVAGGLVAQAISDNSEQDGKVLYVLSLKTGNARRLWSIYVTARLEENSPELLAEFKMEFHPDSDRTLIDYINRLNDVVNR